MTGGAGGIIQPEEHRGGPPKIVRETSPTPRHDPSRARRDASLRRQGLVLAVALVGILLAVEVRDVDNPDHAEALEATEALDRSVDAVRSGSAELTATPQQVVPGVTGARVGSERQPLLVAEAAGRCYTVLLTSTGDQIGQRFSQDWACEPSSAMLLSGPQRGRTQLAPAPATQPYDWEAALPDPLAWRPWYLATVILLAGVAIGAAARLVITLISGSAPGDEADLDDAAG